MIYLVPNESMIILKKNMVEENIIQEFQLKNIDETRIGFIEEINQKALMTKNHEKVCTTLNLVKNYLF